MERGPWIAGMDFPFGMSRRFIENIGWPTTWPMYVQHARLLGREGFRDVLNAYRETRDYGEKEHLRATDRAAGAISPQKLYGVPVALMFFEGAPRLVTSGATIQHLQVGDPQRIVVEAYPGVLARRLIGRRGYKTDTRSKQRTEHRDARVELLIALRQKSESLYGFAVDAPDGLCDDPTGDRLDAFLCAVQAAWAWRQQGLTLTTRDVDTLEGWIADPLLQRLDC